MRRSQKRTAQAAALPRRYSVDGRYAMADRKFDEGGEVFDSQLVHDPGAVSLNRPRRKSENGCGFGVRAALYDQPKHFTLARSKVFDIDAPGRVGKFGCELVGNAGAQKTPA